MTHSDHLCNLYGPALVSEVGKTHAIAKTVDEDSLLGEAPDAAAAVASELAGSPPPPPPRSGHLS